MTRDDAGERIQFLQEFHTLLLDHFEDRYRDGRDHRSIINRRLEVAKRYVAEVGVGSVVEFWVNSSGGSGRMVMDVLDGMFTDLPMHSVLVEAMDVIDKAIGAYQASDFGEVDLRAGGTQTADIENAIERALRPAFKRGPPESEKDVTDVVETILNSLGVEFTREKDRVVVGERAFCPDFAMDDLGLAIEVKLTRESLKPSVLQEQMAADIAAYPVRWRRIIFVVYDLGVIDDPKGLRSKNLKHFGVSVVIVKH